ncbi:YwbE family protein [Sediminitomix flava]|nr:YwbE family protein [Sediminitomix flava]
MDGKNRKDVKIGQYVAIVLKADQRTGDLTEGIVKRILTKSGIHPHGIKVMLDTGEVGRVKKIFPDEEF